jgi:AcrR family transcriptional regulator
MDKVSPDKAMTSRAAFTRRPAAFTLAPTPRSGPAPLTPCPAPQRARLTLGVLFTGAAPADRFAAAPSREILYRRRSTPDSTQDEMTSSTLDGQDRRKKTPGPGGQEARRARTRDLLVETAARLFSQTHPEAVTIDDIIQAAGLAKGTFYNHFVDKAALSLEVRRRVMSRSEEGVRSLNAGIEDAAIRIARGICFYARLALRDPVHAGLLAQNPPLELASEVFNNIGVVVDVAQGISAGRLRVASRESGAVFVIGAGWSLMHCILTEPSLPAAVLLTQQVTSMTLKGLGLDGLEADRLAAICCQAILHDDAPAPGLTPQGESRIA